MNNIIGKILDDLEDSINKNDVKYFYFGKPYAVDNNILNAGALFVTPVRTDVESVTTGLKDHASNEIEIVLAKNVKPSFYKDAQKDAGHSFLTRVMEGTDESGALLTNTVRYIIRNKMRDYGILQDSMSIEYDDRKFEYDGCVTATMRITQVVEQSQPI